MNILQPSESFFKPFETFECVTYLHSYHLSPLLAACRYPAETPERLVWADRPSLQSFVDLFKLFPPFAVAKGKKAGGGCRVSHHPSHHAAIQLSLLRSKSVVSLMHCSSWLPTWTCPQAHTSIETSLSFISISTMSSERRQFAPGGWQVDWQAWPFESDIAGPSPAPPSSHLDITQGVYVQDMQPQFNFDDFDYENVDFNAESPDFADIFNTGEPEIAMPAVPVDSLEQQEDQIVSVQAAAPKRPRKPRTQGPSAGQWNAHKTAIYDLYMHQDKTLKETMETMKDTHGFVAT